MLRSEESWVKVTHFNSSPKFGETPKIGVLMGCI
jgi:hypothetical protein